MARATYCSMVDSTLKMRQTRTMRKLRMRTRSQCHARAARPRPLRHSPGRGGVQGARLTAQGLGTSARGLEGPSATQPRPPGARHP